MLKIVGPSVVPQLVLKIVGPSVVPQLVPSLADTLPLICTCSRHVNAAVRSAVASCLGALANSWLEELMPPLLRLLVPQLGSRDDSTRLGAVEVVVQLVSQLGSKLVAYAVLLVVPLLKRMSDSSAPGLPNPPGLDGEQEATVLRDTAFLLQLLDNRCVEDYVLPVMLPVSLRPYQQEGINWLAFLRRFGLHGVLADDMGLGKTLQATAIMSAVALECSQQYQSSGSSEDLPRPCLVLCPSTLVAHWSHEIHRWVGHVDIFKTLMYQGSPAARLETQATLAGLLKKMHAPPTAGTAPSPTPIVIMSYESVRADVEWVSSIQWLYCCCDEGHIIKSPKSKITQACKKACRRVTALHRLLLSGTPIQNNNNVLELWSLFDFLMPGFLGPERDFNARYGKALQAAKYSKKGSREAEAGLLAVEALHKQVMPFVLRRTKGQVLHDLPPKIIQDVYCEMSELQQRLYDDFMNTQGNNALEATIKGGADNAGNNALEATIKGGADNAGNNALEATIKGGADNAGNNALEATIKGGADNAGNNAPEATIKGGAENAGAEAAVQSKGHVFQALQYMRRLCSHPAMVVDLKQPKHQQAMNDACGTRNAQANPSTDKPGVTCVEQAMYAPQPKHRQAMSEVCGTSDVRACEAALHQVAVAPKLVALRDILSQSGVISGVTGEEGDCPEEGCGSGHRLLVFAQMKAMLDLVEKDLLTPLGVSFLRIDGGVEPNSRFSIVQRFNSDPTIDVLLLTTAVGGLGLNLTSADTVVFLEHDWNPMKDLQAMDRAHRLGQTRTVNVYRLLMRDTLEERIMGLQKFKIEVANSVINQDNMSLKEMDTDKLLDLFSEEQAGKGKEGAKDGKAKSGLQAVLADMGELWDESQYDNEFSMKSFMDKDNMSLKEMDTDKLLDLFSEEQAGKGKEGAKDGKAKSGLQAVLADMGELWDESQYDNEFSMKSFMDKDNMSLKEMDTDKLLDLFSEEQAGKGKEGAKDGKAKSGLQAVLADMGELWDESQYDNEFSMKSFMDKDNMSLKEMDTDKLLDLFSEEQAGKGKEGAKDGKAKSGLQAVLADMGELWDESQYDNEFSMKSFMDKDNMSLKEMDTDKLLDLFSEEQAGKGKEGAKDGKAKSGLQAVLADMGELWDESQYDNEFSMKSFMDKDNMSLKEMDTDKLLDLFSEEQAGKGKEGAKDGKAKSGLQAVLADMGELWDESQYDNEFSMKSFMDKDNMSLKEMDTDKLLDLFSEEQAGKGKEGAKDGKAKSGLQAVLADMGELWDESQYDNEFSMKSFMDKDNMSLKEMDTDKLLDLFSEEQAGKGKEGAKDGKAKSGLQAVLADMGELWDESQYDNEFSMKSFMDKDNMSLKEMDTDKLLDLFSEEQAGKGKEGAKDGKAKSGLQAVLADMGELWDESQYDNEFSMKSFMDKVAPTPAPKE
eukprot:gene22197-29257_t